MQNGETSAQPPLSNSERKRQEREKLLVEQRRAEKISNGDVTAHRAEELYWKTRGSEPEWNKAVSADSNDIMWTDTEAADAVKQGIWKDRHSREWQIQSCMLNNGKQALLFSDRPGLIYLPNYLNLQEQRSLITACLHETTGPASRTNLNTHYVPPPEGWWKAYSEHPDAIVQPQHMKINSHKCSGAVSSNHTDRKSFQRVQTDLPPMNKDQLSKDADLEKKDSQASDTVQPAPLSELIRKMRWTILGLEYHWGTKSYKWDKPPMPMPYLVTSISQSIVQSIPWSTVFGTSCAPDKVDYSTWAETYRPEAGVVNFYQYRDTLTAHIDQSEVDTMKPLISISLGESGIFLVGGECREDQPIPLLLQSGDVVVMSGKSRRVFHGVPRIIEGKMREGFLEDGEGWKEWEDGTQIREFVKGTRININVRHVFSEG